MSEESERAYRRSKRLLNCHLDRRQQRMLRDHGFFYLRGSNRKFYALTTGWTFYEVDKATGVPILGCWYQGGLSNRFRYPKPDRILGQVLALRAKASLLIASSCYSGGQPRSKKLAEGILFKAEHYAPRN